MSRRLNGPFGPESNPLGRYILRGREIVPCPDLMEWGSWMEEAERLIALTGNSALRVSTVFLGLDHNFWGDGPPVLFETMIFGGEHDQDQWRYSTYEEAEAGHAKAVSLAFPTLVKA